MTDAITRDRIERIRSLATQLRDDLNLRGRWGWYGTLGGQRGDGPHLSTQRGGRWHVMRFARLGFGAAQPEFPVLRGAMWPLVVMSPGAEIPVFEVCPEAASKDDPRVYRTNVTGFRSPVADYLAEVDAETVLALLDRIDELEAARG